MSTPTDHARELPPPVVARCADESCHGRQTVGPNALAQASYEESLRILSRDLTAARLAATNGPTHGPTYDDPVSAP